MNGFSISNKKCPHSSSFKIKPNLKIYDAMRMSYILGCKKVSEKVERDFIELLKETPQDEIGEGWQNYVIFKDSKVATSMRYDADQERYGNWMDYSVKIAAKGLNEKGWSFNELLEFLCFARCYIAYAIDYGDLREDEMKTHIYENQPYSAMLNLYQSYLPDGETCKLKNSEDEKKFIHVSRINNKKIKLSKISIDVLSSSYSKQYGSLRHTAVKNVPIIMNFVETDLYPRALNESDRQELIKNLGRTFWWICQAKPWKRGDPSIAEMLIRSIWALKGFEQPAWKDGIVPWVEVSIEPDVEKFAENFYKLFK